MTNSTQQPRDAKFIPPATQSVRPAFRHICLSLPVEDGNNAATSRKTFKKLKRFVRQNGFSITFRKFDDNTGIIRFHMMAYSGADEIIAFCEHVFGPHTTCSSAMNTHVSESYVEGPVGARDDLDCSDSQNKLAVQNECLPRTGTGKNGKRYKKNQYLPDFTDEGNVYVTPTITYIKGVKRKPPITQNPPPKRPNILQGFSDDSSRKVRVQGGFMDIPSARWIKLCAPEYNHNGVQITAEEIYKMFDVNFKSAMHRYNAKANPRDIIHFIFRVHMGDFGKPHFHLVMWGNYKHALMFWDKKFKGHKSYNVPMGKLATQRLWYIAKKHPNDYMIVKRRAWGIFGNPPAAKVEARTLPNDKHGKCRKLILDETNDYGQNLYQFNFGESFQYVKKQFELHNSTGNPNT